MTVSKQVQLSESQMVLSRCMHPAGCKCSVVVLTVANCNVKSLQLLVVA